MSDEQVLAFLTPFTSQSPITHFVAVLLGGVVFTSMYLFTLGDAALAAATGSTAIAVRQTATLVAGVATGVYFALTYTRAIGGPGLNILYPILTIVTLPYAIAMSQGGVPAQLWTEAEFIFSVQFIIDGLKVGLPGVVAFIAVMLGWFFIGLGSEDAVEEWLTTHTSTTYQQQVLNRK
ncbi:hypothetical protein SAMN04487948_1166 [Halogranum amylolyticum]|uniref:Uncharacterized protein n=1 Tax=Halogranum amylolyticum TaxID=660520 RepID=A0A1H8VDU9_9EURY|nr:hypothetical protein [Halogranum amylolyticum]SEP13595.1 hypothetical protein SAMN04487948_1166 [Halogranum amylolyticum]